MSRRTVSISICEKFAFIVLLFCNENAAPDYSFGVSEGNDQLFHFQQPSVES